MRGRKACQKGGGNKRRLATGSAFLLIHATARRKLNGALTSGFPSANAALRAERLPRSDGRAISERVGEGPMKDRSQPRLTMEKKSLVVENGDATTTAAK